MILDGGLGHEVALVRVDPGDGRRRGRALDDRAQGGARGAQEPRDRARVDAEDARHALLLEPLRERLHRRVVGGREGVLRHDHGHGEDLNTCFSEMQTMQLKNR